MTPNQTFWEHDLELPFEHLRHQSLSEGFWERWQLKLTFRQRSQLAVGLGLPAPKKHRTAKLFEVPGDQLFPFFLVQEFSSHKNRKAVFQYATSVLGHQGIEDCGGASADSFTLCLAMFHQNPLHLAALLNWNKVVKKGFARMRMIQDHRKPVFSLERGMPEERVRAVLHKFDKKQGGYRITELKGWQPRDDHLFVFIRRSDHPDYILRNGGGIQYGYSADWIVLDFFDGAKQVNIASGNTSGSLRLAELLASEYFNATCAYDNDRPVTYEYQLKGFLNRLLKGTAPKLELVEIVVNASPLMGGPKIKLCHEETLVPGIEHFTEKIEPLWTKCSQVESLRVLFEEKRVYHPGKQYPHTSKSIPS